MNPYPKRWLVFGGSFNPVHLGHVALMQAVLARPDVARLLVVPAGRSPFKTEAELLPAPLRWRLLQNTLAALPKADQGRVELVGLEMAAPPPSYTVETLAQLVSTHPEADWWLLMGADVFQGFARWKQAARILEMAALAIMARPEEKPTADLLPALLADWLPLLPQPWPGLLTPAQPLTTVHPTLLGSQGRPKLELWPLATPPVSASHIRARHDLSQVPPAARPLLAAHWDF